MAGSSSATSVRAGTSNISVASCYSILLLLWLHQNPKVGRISSLLTAFQSLDTASHGQKLRGRRLARRPGIVACRPPPPIIPGRTEVWEWGLRAHGQSAGGVMCPHLNLWSVTISLEVRQPDILCHLLWCKWNTPWFNSRELLPTALLNTTRNKYKIQHTTKQPLVCSKVKFRVYTVNRGSNLE